MKQSHLLLLIAAVLCVGYALWQGIDVRAQTETAAPFDVPSPTPTATSPSSDGGAVPPLDSPLPTPTPTAPPPSPAAEAALRSVAERQGIPVEELTVGSEQPVSFELLGRSYTYVTIHHNHPDGFRLFAVLVDPATLAVDPDYNAVRAAEEAAYRARYGRLHPSLHERLQEVGDEELLPVVVWVAQTGAGRSQEEIEAEVVARYPAAGEARAEDGVLWAVADPDLAREIQQTYEQLLFESVAVRVQPVAEWLKEQGVVVEEITGMPALSATLPKRTIVALNERDDVAQIFLTEGEAVPEARIAIATNRVSHIWARGYTGTGSRIAILGRSNINATAGACLNIVATRTSIPDPTGHKSAVAAVAACNNIANSPGVAPGAQILDAGHADTEADIIEALKWATDPSAATPAHVVNQSEGIGSDNLLQFTDRAYDYWIKARNFTAVKSAGNNAGNVTSPGKAYNIIAVGNVNDQNTASWSDDDMWWESSYFNPYTGVEKPEVAAPGTNIDTIAGTWTGTSVAAPQVAGLAALLMQRHSDLKNFPTAVKAIIMASAVHNIEGDRHLSHIDGAGAIDAALADWIAQIKGTTGTCNAPCWWNIPTTDSFPSNGGNVERTFNANRGERIRVVIAWLSYADPPTGSSLDELRRNFDLHVLTPTGGTKTSESAVNNFEIVDFRAPATGQYTIRVIRNSSGDQGNEPGGNLLGIAWVKLATYLPEVRRNSDGWTSTIYVRNDGRTDWQGKVTFFHQGGAYANEASTTLAPNAVWSGAMPASDNWVGTAIVDGSDDISVVIRNDKTGLATLDNGFSAGGATDPAWGVASTVLYAPALYNNIFGGYNSTIFVQNANATGTSIVLPLFGRTGYSDYAGGASMDPGSQKVLPVGPIVSNSSWVGSLYGSADQPVALRIVESKGSGESRSYNASASGRWLVYVPAAYKNAWGFNSGLVIQNLHPSNSTNVTLRYCERTVANPATCPTQTLSNVGARRSVGLNLNNTSLPNGWSGSISLQSSSNSIPLAVLVNNVNSVGGYSFNATGYGSKLIILPRAAKAANNRTTGYTVRNVSGQNNVTVIAYYYRASDGNLTWTRSFTLHSAQSDGYFQTSDTLPDGWEGSIVIEATADIVAVMREDGPATTSAYNGVSR